MSILDWTHAIFLQLECQQVSSVGLVNTKCQNIYIRQCTKFKIKCKLHLNLLNKKMGL